MDTKVKSLPDMWIFDDGEVHFNNKVYSFGKDLKYKCHNPSKLIIKLLPKNITIHKNDKAYNSYKVFESKEFFNGGYGEEKIRILPGD